jgi:excisionase family DNA binding protein
MDTPPLLSQDPILTVPEVARYLKISKSKIYYLISRRQLPHLRIGRNVRVRQSDLKQWIEKTAMTSQ